MKKVLVTGAPVGDQRIAVALAAVAAIPTEALAAGATNDLTRAARHLVEVVAGIARRIETCPDLSVVRVTRNGPVRIKYRAVASQTLERRR